MLNAAKTNDNESPDYSHIFSSGEPKKNVASKVLKYLLKANLKVFIISVILFIIKNAAPYVLPIITSEVINVATNPAEREITELAFYGGLIIFLVVQNLYTHMVYVKYSSRALRNIGAGFRNSLVKKLQQISLVYQKEFKTGALQSKFIRDIETIEGFLDNIMLVLMPAVLSLLVTTSVTLVKSPIVALFFILVVPVNVAVIRHFRKPLGEVNRSFRQTMEKTSAKMSNMIEMIPVTKAHGLEETEVRRLEHDINDLKMAALSMDYISGRFGSSAWVASQLMNICCLLFTGVLAYYGKISVGEVVLYQSYFTTITANVSALLNIAPAFAKGSEAINSVSEVIFSDEIEDNKGKIRLRYVHGSIDFQNVSYRYPGAEEDTIKNLSLSVNPGECIAFVGSSGSGKTTVMNMIIGFLKANSGQLLIDGKPIELINLTDYRHFLSVVPQNCVLFSGTIRENILYGLENVPEDRLNKIVELANIKEFIDELPDGLDTVVEEHGSNLSGGQKQRISIARALIRDPKIIILDEATSALDNISEYHVQKAMNSLIEGRTTFIVAHRLSTIRNADKIVVLEKGECVEFGTYDELMAKQGQFYQLKTLSDLTAK